MANLAGTCGKCGAPYFYTDEAYGGTVAPPVRPTCQCWNMYSEWKVTTTKKTTTYECPHCMCISVPPTTGSAKGTRCCKCSHTIHTGVVI